MRGSSGEERNSTKELKGFSPNKFVTSSILRICDDEGVNHVTCNEVDERLPGDKKFAVAACTHLLFDYQERYFCSIGRTQHAKN